MKTTHQIAKELLALPDVNLVIEGWCDMRGYELAAKMTEYDPIGTAILMQECVDEEVRKETQEWIEKNSTWGWMNPSANTPAHLTCGW